MSDRYKKIGLLDHMGFGNMGDAAVQEAFIANIKRRLPNADLIGFSLYPDDTQKRHNIASYPIRWWNPGLNGSGTSSPNLPTHKSRLKVLLKSCRPLYAVAKPVHDLFREFAHLIRSYQVVRSLDLLIISGGGQLCDLHGDLPYNVFKFCFLARLAKKRVFMVGVGADLLRRPLNKAFARWSVRLAHYASFRSDESQELIRSLGVNKETHVCPDPAYSLNVPEYLASEGSHTLSPLESRALLSNLGLALELHTHPALPSPYDCSFNRTAGPAQIPTRKVGLNPMGFCDPRRWPRRDDAVYHRYLDKVTTFSRWLLVHNYELEIFTSDILMDVFAIEDLKERLLGTASGHEVANVVFRPLSTLEELLRQIAGFDFVVTSKFHGVIFSHIMGKPAIALSYLPKIQQLMRAVGHDQYCLDTEHFEVAALIESFQSLVNEEEYLKGLFRKTSMLYADALRVDFDSLFGKEAISELRLAEAEAAGVVA
jgi:polysaccharide pyruvyl transferase WcaK-like protein